ISSEDPLFVGRPGSLASRGANFALQNSDFLLSIGARLDFAITGFAPAKFARAAHKVMVDTAPGELRKLAPFPRTPVCAAAGLGSMGNAVPGSIGVCLAGGRRRTVCVDGDGGFQFNIQELETIARLNLPIKFFVLNNDGYASIRASQTNFFGSPHVGCDSRTGLTVPDLVKVAAAYGLGTARIASQANLRDDV